VRQRRFEQLFDNLSLVDQNDLRFKLLKAQNLPCVVGNIIRPKPMDCVRDPDPAGDCKELRAIQCCAFTPVNRGIG
jgi:hypothetical protein